VGRTHRRLARRPSLERLDDRCLLSWGLDPTFAGGAGLVTANTGNAGVCDMALQLWGADASGSKVIVTADYTAGTPSQDWGIWRDKGDGTLDPTFGSFGTGGKATFSSTGAHTSTYAIAPSGLEGSGTWTFQSDGKLILSIATYRGGSPSYCDITLARYLPNGELDAAFGTSGIVTTDIGTPILGYTVDNAERPESVAFDAAGNIVVVGSIYTRDADSRNGLIVRYTSTGVLDTSFGTGGAVLAAFSPTSWDALTRAAVQPDGKIVVAGQIDVDPAPPTPSNWNQTWNLSLARYADDGGMLRMASFRADAGAGPSAIPPEHRAQRVTYRPSRGRGTPAALVIAERHKPRAHRRPIITRQAGGWVISDRRRR
jgi:uncharacterized delta-60 repeat protein